MQRPFIPGGERSPWRRALVAVLLFAAARGALAASRPAVRGPSGMVVSAEEHASRVGVDILRRGGNAVDAAVATAFALAVTYPRAGNLGGGGFLLYRSPDGRFFALDFRETAPRSLRASMFLDEAGRPVPERSLRGGLAVGVPGSVAGLAEAHRRWGSLPWRTLLEPAMRLASQGIPISGATAITLAERAQDLASDPAARAIFTREGAPLREGDLLVQKDLAATLEAVAAGGAAAFYRGPIARALAGAVRATGGVLDEEDLARYEPLPRDPVEGSYRGLRVVSFPPPSSGGIVLLEILGMLERFDLAASGLGSSLTVHRMAEAEKRAFADRARWLGDPDYFRVPVRGLLDRKYLAQRSATIRDDEATPSAAVAAGTPPDREGAQTTHLSVGDSKGGAVALTTTLNSWYGTARVAAGTGVLLNNEIDDFALAPGVPNQYGLVGEGDANAVAAGKRPLSSMCPTIVERQGEAGRPLLVIGSPGGPTIITTVLQILVDVVDHRLALQEAVDAPRFHQQWLPDRIDHEAHAFPADVARALATRGHVLQERGPIGDAEAIGVAPDGAWLGAADPRGEGSAAGY